MADCSKTAEFLREWKRLFDNTEIISLRDPKTPKEVLVYNQIMSDLEHPEKTIKYVQKWSDEHPVLTWLDMLKKSFPNADAVAMVAKTCPGWIFGAGPNMFKTECAGKQEHQCAECWLSEYKEAEK